MRRKAGTLVPLEESILSAAIELRRRGEDFHGYQIAKHIADASDRRLLTATARSIVRSDGSRPWACCGADGKILSAPR